MGRDRQCLGEGGDDLTVRIRDASGTDRVEGDLLASGGATGDVLTQQADGTYTPAVAGGGPLTAEVPLTNAEIIAFGATTGVVIVAAPAMGTFVNFIYGVVTIDASAGAYTAAGGDYANGEVGFFWDASANASVLSTGPVLGDLFGSFGSGAVVVLPAQPGGSIGAAGGSSREFSELSGKALHVNGSNALNAPFGGGDAANWGRAKVWYTLEPLTAP